VLVKVYLNKQSSDGICVAPERSLVGLLWTGPCAWGLYTRRGFPFRAEQTVACTWEPLSC